LYRINQNITTKLSNFYLCSGNRNILSTFVLEYNVIFSSRKHFVLWRQLMTFCRGFFSVNCQYNVLNIKTGCENVNWIELAQTLYLQNWIPGYTVSDVITRYIIEASLRKYVCSLNTQNHQKHLCSVVIVILALEILLLPQSPVSYLLQLQSVSLFCNVRKQV
jgi:hypothetical protein